MRNTRGFSLIELLLVVAIILVIAAMAMPNLLRSRISANEASAVASLRGINTAQTTYSFTYPTIGYASTLQALSLPTSGTSVNASHAGLLDWVIGCSTMPCSKNGYSFNMVPNTTTPVAAYDTTAVPHALGRTGNRGFCSNHLTQITFDPAGGSACTRVVE